MRPLTSGMSNLAPFPKKAVLKVTNILKIWVGPQFATLLPCCVRMVL